MQVGVTFASCSNTNMAKRPHVSKSTQEASKFNAGQPDSRAPEIHIVPVSVLTWPWLEPRAPFETPCSKKNSNKWKCFQRSQAKLSKSFKTHRRRNN